MLQILVNKIFMHLIMILFVCSFFVSFHGLFSLLPHLSKGASDNFNCSTHIFVSGSGKYYFYKFFSVKDFLFVCLKKNIELKPKC